MFWQIATKLDGWWKVCLGMSTLPIDNQNDNRCADIFSMSIFDSNSLDEAFKFLNWEFKSASCLLCLQKPKVLLQWSFLIFMEVIAILDLADQSLPLCRIFLIFDKLQEEL